MATIMQAGCDIPRYVPWPGESDLAKAAVPPPERRSGHAEQPMQRTNLQEILRWLCNFP